MAGSGALFGSTPVSGGCVRVGEDTAFWGADAVDGEITAGGAESGPRVCGSLDHGGELVGHGFDLLLDGGVLCFVALVEEDGDGNRSEYGDDGDGDDQLDEGETAGRLRVAWVPALDRHTGFPGTPEIWLFDCFSHVGVIGVGWERCFMENALPRLLEDSSSCSRNYI